MPQAKEGIDDCLISHSRIALLARAPFCVARMGGGGYESAVVGVPFASLSSIGTPDQYGDSGSDEDESMEEAEEKKGRRGSREKKG